jgi:hypothetical protein
MPLRHQVLVPIGAGAGATSVRAGRSGGPTGTSSRGSSEDDAVAVRGDGDGHEACLGDGPAVSTDPAEPVDRSGPEAEHGGVGLPPVPRRSGQDGVARARTTQPYCMRAGS